jgi:hypothetical protein
MKIEVKYVKSVVKIPVFNYNTLKLVKFERLVTKVEE